MKKISLEKNKTQHLLILYILTTLLIGFVFSFATNLLGENLPDKAVAYFMMIIGLGLATFFIKRLYPKNSKALLILSLIGLFGPVILATLPVLENSHIFVDTILAFTLLGSFFVVLFYIFRLFYFLYKAYLKSRVHTFVRKNPIALLNLAGIIIIGIFFFQINSRLANVEQRFGGKEKLSCSEEDIRKMLEDSVVRIIGSFGEGSGFPISQTEIVTNFHVIEDEPSPKVVHSDGTIESPDAIIGNKTNDVAILKFDRDFRSFFFHRWFRNERRSALEGTEPTFGEPVYAAGYPLGSTLPGPVTIVKGSYTGERFIKDFDINTIQSDITLEKGMSGGPLVNSCGEVIGVNTIGLSGTSFFMDIASIKEKKEGYTNEEVAKIEIDTETPEGVVKAFYAYIKARNLREAYYLLSDARLAEIDTFYEWVEGYENTLHVELVLSRIDEDNENRVDVKLASKDWVDGEVVRKYFEGYWIVIEEGNDLRLDESNIRQLSEEPDFLWLYYWEDEIEQ